METGLQLGSLLLHIGSQMRDLTWSNKDPSYKAISIFISAIIFRNLINTQVKNNIPEYSKLN